MKKFIIIYFLFSLTVGVGIYFMTLSLSYNARVNDVFYELADKAVLDQDFDEFISIQSLAYLRISRNTTEYYIIDTYQVIGQDKKNNMNQIGIIVLPIKDVKYAEDVKDENDQTGLRVIDKNLNTTFYETYVDDKVKDVAISYGLNLIDFYFYTLTLEIDMSLGFELYDYDEQLILSFDEDFIYQNYLEKDDSFLEGMDQNKLSILVDQETYVYPKLIKNMTIFIVIDIFIGSIIYFLIRRKKQPQ